MESNFNIEKHFLSDEQALALKELGYRGECAAHYPFDEELHLKWRYYGNMSTHPMNTLQAPTKSQAFEFFREKYGMHHSIAFDVDNNTYDAIIFGEIVPPFMEEEKIFYTYEEAENACLDKLIEIAKQQDN
jgi:hypothetical protein